MSWVGRLMAYHYIITAYQWIINFDECEAKHRTMSQTLYAQYWDMYMYYVLHNLLQHFTSRNVLLSILLVEALCLSEDWLKAVLGYVQGDLKRGWSLHSGSLVNRCSMCFEYVTVILTCIECILELFLVTIGLRT